MWPRRDPVLPGQRSVWDFPRPPAVVPNTRTLQVVFAGEVIAQTTGGFAVLETSHPPTYYLPPGDVHAAFLRPHEARTLCEFKGAARYLDVAVGDRVAARAAWSYAAPTDPRMADHVAFYAGLLDRCTVDGQIVRPQEGRFYGGWITDDLAGFWVRGWPEVRKELRARYPKHAWPEDPASALPERRPRRRRR